MARKRKKIEPAVRTIMFPLQGNNGNATVDLAHCLSAINRRLYSQNKMYYVSRLELVNLDTRSPIDMNISVAPNTWVTRNALTKSKALFNEMNRKVLDDSPSIQAKWHDYKVYLDGEHADGSSPNLTPLTANYGNFGTSESPIMGEWEYSKYVLPEHDVNPATGAVLPADEFTTHICGPDLGSGLSKGIIQAFQETRAQVDASPTVPEELSSSWMTLLTDDGSQEPELAEILEDANDEPPYSMDIYGGAVDPVAGTLNMPTPIQVQWMMAPDASVGQSLDKSFGFEVPCGLMRLRWGFTNGDSSSFAYLVVHLLEGDYKGVHTEGVRQ